MEVDDLTDLLEVSFVKYIQYNLCYMQCRYLKVLGLTVTTTG